MTAALNPMAKAFVTGFNAAPLGALIGNAATTMALHDWGDIRVPVSINHGEPNGTFVCCPRIGWVDFVREELARFPNKWLVPPLKTVVAGVDILARICALDRIVHVNNWMMSTNLPSAIDPTLSGAQTRVLTQRFPEHILAMRSLTRHQSGALMDALEAAGWICLPTRQVFIVDDVAKDSLSRRDSKNDARLWQKTDLHYEELAEVNATDAARIAHLYALLYLRKYSRLNPQYLPAFVTFAHQIGLLRFLVLRDRSGVIQSFGGMLHMRQHATMPLLGYNTALDRQLGLYRLACHTGSLYAARHHLNFNMSSGAGAFKQTRGARAEIEYTAYFVRHLPRKRRMPFRGLQAIGKHVGIPILRKYNL